MIHAVQIDAKTALWTILNLLTFKLTHLLLRDFRIIKAPYLYAKSKPPVAIMPNINPALNESKQLLKKFQESKQIDFN